MGTRVALLAVAAACGSPGPRSETRVEAELRRALGDAIGMQVARVTCGPAVTGSAELRSQCIALVESIEVPIALTHAGSAVAWEVGGLIVAAGSIEAEVSALLGELDVIAQVDCGRRVRVVAAGERVACTIAGAIRAATPVADTGIAFATFDADGGAEIEIALGAEAVSARTASLAEAELDALSRALDRDDDGAASEEDGAGVGSSDAATADAAATTPR